VDSAVPPRLQKRLADLDPLPHGLLDELGGQGYSSLNLL